MKARTFYLVIACNIRYSTKFSSQLITDLIDCVIFTVHSSNKQIVWDVIQMTTEFQPGSSSTDMVSGAFALHLGTALIKFIDKQNPESQISKAPVCQITFMSTCMFSRSLPCHLSKGSSSCRRLLCGLTSTLRPEPSAGGCWYVSCPGSKSREGNSSPVGGSSLNFSPLGAVR